MTLSQFIEKVGVSKLAFVLDVTPAAVSHWRSGKNTPPPVYAYKIIKLSNHSLDFDSIYLPFVKKRTKGIVLQIEDAFGNVKKIKL